MHSLPGASDSALGHRRPCSCMRTRERASEPSSTAAPPRTTWQRSEGSSSMPTRKARDHRRCPALGVPVTRSARSRGGWRIGQRTAGAVERPDSLRRTKASRTPARRSARARRA
eukprot:6212913-Pleurochrysis_carterae.AAC.1